MDPVSGNKYFMRVDQRNNSPDVTEHHNFAGITHFRYATNDCDPWQPINVLTWLTPAEEALKLPGLRIFKHDAHVQNRA